MPPLAKNLAELKAKLVEYFNTLIRIFLILLFLTIVFVTCNKLVLLNC